jgi:hypothetical protein
MRRASAAIIFAMLIATTAHAQPGSRVSLGAGIGFHNYRDASFPTNNNWSLVPEYNIRLSSNGNRQGLSFGFKGGVTYSQPDREDFIGGVETKSGNLRMVSVLVGAGPTYRTGPFSVGLGVVAGPSFNNFSVDDAARVAYRDRFGETLNSITAKNSIAVKPNLGVWYDLTDRLALHSSVDYTVNRPQVITNIDGNISSQRWMLDRWGYQLGLAYGIF